MQIKVLLLLLINLLKKTSCMFDFTLDFLESPWDTINGILDKFHMFGFMLRKLLWLQLWIFFQLDKKFMLSFNTILFL